MAAVIACSSPPKKFTKFKNKSAELTCSPDLLQEVLPQASGLNEPFVVRKRGAGRCSKRSGVSLARRAATGGRGAGPIGAVAVVRQKEAQRVAVHASDLAHSRISFTQAQPPRKSGVEPHAAILEERELGGAFKMAAPSEGIFPLPRTLEEGQLDASVKMAARSEFVGEDVIIISDEETERLARLRLVEGDNNLQSFGQLGGRVSSEVTVHRKAGRPAGGQSASVKVGAPLGHRRKGRVKSGAVYPTARESVLSGSLVHGAGSVLDEQPFTSRGASARFECTEEEWLDYEEDVEEQVMPALKSVAKGATQSVPEVVRGDRSGNHHRDVAVGNLARGEEFDWGSANFGFGRQVGVGSGANFGSGPQGLVS
ncbi:hypothetical protein NDU88_005483 [Pleurodeles waltl]|uniref:Uncharacterized protein n=1 Tax=Pleurodeles waltl TaxID=8319 RepID=A0AAV7WB54_PLEWA|nr:hypothetical protein NDU88_005483 [Pleurodeles waltl]